MHYCAFCFSKAGLPVLESIPAGIPMSNDTGYSAGDIDSIERLYGATPSQVTVVTNPVGLKIMVDGTPYTAPQSFSWAVNSTHTLGLPPDPQYTAPADGSTYTFGNWNDLGARTHTITVQGGSGGLTSPANLPAVTMYEANFIRLQPLTYQPTPVSVSYTHLDVYKRQSARVVKLCVPAPAGHQQLQGHPQEHGGVGGIPAVVLARVAGAGRHFLPGHHTACRLGGRA